MIACRLLPSNAGILAIENPVDIDVALIDVALAWDSEAAELRRLRWYRFGR
jgi:hypothetical protein